MKNLSAKQRALVEHYVAALIVAGVGIWSTGNHDIKKVAWAALIAVFGPVVKTVFNYLQKEAATPVAK